MGLTVLGTAGTPRGLDIAKREGAHEVFNHRIAGYQEEILQATGNRGVDIILEMLANVTSPLANNGRVIVIGSRGEVTINPRELMDAALQFAGSRFGPQHLRKRRTFTPGSLQASKTALPPARPRAHTRRSLSPDQPARSCSSAY